MSLGQDPIDIFQAFSRLEKELPSLVGPKGWEAIKERLERLKERFAQSTDPKELRQLAAELLKILVEYDVARQRLWEELRLSTTVKGDSCRLVTADETSPRGPQEIPRQPQQRTVNTGFAQPGKNELSVDKQKPLQSGRNYYFWLEVGRQLPEAIDITPTELPPDLVPRHARIKVALFSFPGEIEIADGADVGELELKAGGSKVLRQPGHPEDLSPTAKILKRRLFFPVVTPDRSGVFRLRCNLYYEQVLVQSHLVQVEVNPGAARLPALQGLSPGPALQTIVDYSLSASLRPLPERATHTLSLMLNDNGDGTHGFRIFGAAGAEEFKNDAVIDGQELQAHIINTRKALRQVAWGNPLPWQEGEKYRYASPPLDSVFRNDLALLAKIGTRIYVALVNRLAGGKTAPEIRKAREKLEELMLHPVWVQLASKVSVRHIVPLSLFYDYPLDDTQPPEKYSLCSTFLKDQQKGSSLAETPCFQGACPSRGNMLVICPSGFWGYRHRLGLPPSVTLGKDCTSLIPYEDIPHLTMAVSTDPHFKLRSGHEAKLKALPPVHGWHYAQTRDEAIKVMKEQPAQIVYFYCHGGLNDQGVPYIEVGSGEQGITQAYIYNSKIYWENQPRPLIFINGCHTTALEPEQTYDLVTAFVEDANAAGVIGTEITTFEPLACSFAEECLQHFLNGTDIGEAMRVARLKLLQEKNPLGLIYISFVLSNLSLVRIATLTTK